MRGFSGINRGISPHRATAYVGCAIHAGLRFLAQAYVRSVALFFYDTKEWISHDTCAEPVEVFAFPF
jgi:hypothetical protein